MQRNTLLNSAGLMLYNVRSIDCHRLSVDVFSVPYCLQTKKWLKTKFWWSQFSSENRPYFIDSTFRPPFCKASTEAEYATVKASVSSFSRRKTKTARIWIMATKALVDITHYPINKINSNWYVTSTSSNSLTTLFKKLIFKKLNKLLNKYSYIHSYIL